MALSPHLTSDKARLARVLHEEVWSSAFLGGFPFGTAIDTAVGRIASETGRRVVLLIADARRPSCAVPQACVSEAEALRVALDHNLLIYGVELKGAWREITGSSDRAFWNLTDQTGGGYLRLDPEADLDETFAGVVEELRWQYLLAFSPPVHDAESHSIEVQVTRPGLTVRARKTYQLRDPQ